MVPIKYLVIFCMILSIELNHFRFTQCKTVKEVIMEDKAKLNLKNLDIQIENVDPIANTYGWSGGPRPDQGAGDMQAWTQGDIRLAHEDNESDAHADAHTGAN